MNETAREVLAGVLAGGMAAGTAVVTALQETPLADMSDGQWVTISLGGFLAAGAGWKALLARPPQRTGY